MFQINTFLILKFLPNVSDWAVTRSYFPTWKQRWWVEFLDSTWAADCAGAMVLFLLMLSCCQLNISGILLTTCSCGDKLERSGHFVDCRWNLRTYSRWWLASTWALPFRTRRTYTRAGWQLTLSHFHFLIRHRQIYNHNIINLSIFRYFWVFIVIINNSLIVDCVNDFWMR